MARVITIAGGRSGVGKTSIGVNLALHLARQGRRTCLFDAESGVAIIQSLLGVKPDGSLKEITGCRRSLADILIRDYQGIDVLPGSSAVELLAGFEVQTPKPVNRRFDALQEYEYFLIDAPAGLCRATLAFCLASTQVILVVTPEQDSLTGAYGFIKMLHMNTCPGGITAVVNRCKIIDDGRHAYGALHQVAKSYFNMDIPLLGLVFEDAELGRSFELRQAVALRKPESMASRCIRDFAKQLLEDRAAAPDDEDMQGFWSRLLWLLNRPLILPRAGREVESLPAAAPATGLSTMVATTTRSDARTPSPPALFNQMVVTLFQWLNKVREWQPAGGDPAGAATMARVLGDYAYQKQQVGYREAKMDIYYVERDGLPTLSCAYHGPQADHEGRGDQPSHRLPPAAGNTTDTGLNRIAAQAFRSPILSASDRS